MSDSTPTTLIQVNAAVEAVNSAQEPLPWDPNCYWPRTNAINPVPQIASYTAPNLTIAFDTNIDSQCTAAQFELGTPHADPAKCYRAAVLIDDAGDNELLIIATPSTDVLNRAPYVLWDPEQDPGNDWTDEDGNPILGFQLSLVEA